jgi:RNA polymerase sigma-70 factor (ECF subfamily)
MGRLFQAGRFPFQFSIPHVVALKKAGVPLAVIDEPTFLHLHATRRMRMHLSKSIAVVDLVEAARGGCQRAFQELYWRYRWLVVSEIHQETFANAFIKLANLRKPSRFSTWLRLIARHRACDWLRVHDREIIRFGNDCSGFADPRPGPEALLEAVEERQLVDAGLALLSETDRRMLEQFHRERLSVREIAACFGRATGTIKRRLHEARRRLRKIVEERRGLLE